MYVYCVVVLLFKQKTAYEMRIRDWSSDVCSSDLILPLERTGEVLEAPAEFMLVVSYNPGYQNILKALKPSTKQRFVAIEFDFLPKEQEVAIVAAESGLDERHVAPLEIGRASCRERVCQYV